MSLRIKAIIILMSLALLGLIGIQFYWIDSAIVLRQEEFNQKVSFALRNVVHDLEKKEALDRFREHQKGRELMRRQVMRRRRKILERNAKVDARYDQKAAISFFRNAQNGGLMKITESHSPDSNARIITKEFIGGNMQGSSVEIDFRYAGNGKHSRSAEQNRLALDFEMEDSLANEKIDEKTAILDDIFYDLVQVQRFSGINDRLDFRALDSIIKARLNEVLIQTEVRMAVFDYFGTAVEDFENTGSLDNLRKSIYKARLFPNDFFGDPFYLSLIFPNQKGFLLQTMWTTLSISALFLLLIIGAFSYTIYIIQNQKQLSIIKNDFINNMTHELKTPISTISLACEALNDNEVTTDNNKRIKFLSMISQENSRLGTLVENVLKSSIWDKSDFKMNFETLDIHELIAYSSDSCEIQLQSKKGTLQKELSASNFKITGDRVHITNLVNNLLDNAIKYSAADPLLVVRTRNDSQGIIIEVEDNGIGIPKEHQKKIFEKFYRVPTGNVHNVKGFGLGLNYVANVVNNHQGTIEVRSTSGKGTTFTIWLPENQKTE